MKRSLILIVLAALFACEQPSLTPVYQDFTVKNGRLVFSDFDRVVMTMKQIAHLPDDELAAWSQNIKGFTSLKNSSSALELPKDYASIINKNGVYQVGSDIIVNYDGSEYIIADENEVALAQFLQSHTVTEGIKRHVISHEIMQPVNSATNREFQNWQKEFTSGGGRFKFVIEAFAYGYYGYIRLGFRTRLEYLDKRTIGHDQWLKASEPFKRKLSWRVRGNYQNGSQNELDYTQSLIEYVGNENYEYYTDIVANCIGPMQWIINEYYALVNYNTVSGSWLLEKTGTNNFLWCK